MSRTRLGFRPLGLLSFLGVLVAPATTQAQSFQIDGVIHDAQSLRPIPGVAVFLRNEATGALLSPGELDPPEQQGQITQVNGRYAFRVRTPGLAVRLELERPDSRFIFPSQSRAPEGPGPYGGAACGPEVACPGGLINFEPEPTAATRYVLRFITGPVGSGRNNHLPIDDLSRLITAHLSADRQRARRGELVRFLARFESAARDPIGDASIVLDLPPELRLRDGTLELRRIRGGVPEVLLLNPRRSTLFEAWAVPEIQQGDRLELSFLARVAQAGRTPKVLAKTRLERQGGIGISDEAVASLALEDDPLLDEGTILGQVYCERPDGKPNWVDPGERGLYGARIYLDTGFHADTDVDGHFHFSGVPAGTRILKLDPASLPPGSVPPAEPVAQRLLSPGAPAQVFFPVTCALAAWGPPSQIALATPPGPPPPATVNLPFAFDPLGRSYQLGEWREPFPRAGLLLAFEAGRLRLWPALEAQFAPTRWRVLLSFVDATGVVLSEPKFEWLTGPGAPPLTVEGPPPVPPPGAVALRARLKVEFGELDALTSAPTDLLLAPAVAPTTTVARSLGVVATPAIDAAGAALKAALVGVNLNAGERLEVQAHWDGGQGGEEAGRQAEALLEGVRAVLRELGLGPERAVLINRADQVPRVPSASPRLRALNRRLELSVLPAPPSRPRVPRPPVQPGLVLRIDRQEAPLPLLPQSLTLELDVPAQVDLHFTEADGHEVHLTRGADARQVLRPGPKGRSVAVLADGALQLGDELRPLPGAWTVRGGHLTRGGATTTLHLGFTGAADAQTWRVRWAVDPSATQSLAVRSGEGALPSELELSTTSTAAKVDSFLWVEVDRGGVRAVAGPGRVDAGSGRITWPTVEPGLRFLGQPVTGPAPLANGVLEVAGAVRTLVPLGDALPVVPEPTAEPGAPPPESVAAADTTIESARLDGALPEPRLPLTGHTRPGNRIAVDGVDVPVSEEGHFAYTAPLGLGRRTLRVEATDPEGHRAVFLRPVETSSHGWFLLALAEAQLGTGGARLWGSNQQTHLDLDPIGLDGRLAAFGRARFVLDGPFRRVEVTGRFDTAEIGGPRVLRLGNDPLRLLPAFGDASLEVQDTQSRHLLYVDVRADDSRVVVGNHTTVLGPEDDPAAYLQFRRSGFGAHADVRYRFGGADETRVKALYADGNQGSVRGHDELRGTGGSFYWLSHDEVVEGSVRARLVIRDANTGQVVSEQLLVEGQDFEIRPREGRLSLRTPLPGQVGEGTIGLNRSVTHTGQPIDLVVDYEYLTDGSDERAFGAEVRERLFDQLELRATWAGEDRGLDQHRLYGVGLTYAPTRRTRFFLEYAQSSGRTTAGRLSLDGGLTFLDLDAAGRRADQATPDPEREAFFDASDHRAYGVRGTVDAADVGLFEPERLVLSAYGRRAGTGFSSLGSAKDAGRVEAGGRLAAQLRPGWTASAHVDGAKVASGAKSVLWGAEVDYRDRLQSGQLAFAHLSGGLGLDDGDTTGVGLRYERAVLPALRLRIAQDALLQAGPEVPSGLGALGTTVGARYRLSDAVSLDAAQLVRWNGDHHSQFGLSFETEEGLTGYVAERFTPVGRGLLTTIIGAEDHFGEASRTYGELQVDGGAHPGTSRAVLGMDHHFRVADGVELLLAYERAQLTDQFLPAGADSPYTTLFGAGAPTLGGFGGPVRLLPGAIARDALALGATWIPLRRLAFTSRFELRVDDGDEGSGGRDFLTLGGHAGLTFQAHRDWTLFGRLSFQRTQDQLRDLRYAHFVEGSVRGAFRPHEAPWLTVLLGYTRQSLERPPEDPTQRSTPETKDAFSVEPIVETPFGVQLVERLALLRNALLLPDGRSEEGLNVLWINRINAQVYGPFEGAVEFRMLLDLALSTAEQGFLVEAGYVPEEHVRIGVGYNFTRFGDDVLLLATEQNGGPFLRVTARY